MKHQLETLTKCPLCGSEDFSLSQTSTDYTVSKEEFNIDRCNVCNLLFTNPRPSEKDIGHYYKSEDYVSHTRTKKGLINKVYHKARDWNLKQKVKAILNVTGGFSTIIDYGAGTGDFLKYVQKLGAKTYGFEPDQDARNVCQKENNIQLKPIKEFENHEEKVDVITLWHVLEHVHRLNELVELFNRKIKNDGVVVIAVPNPSSFDAKHYKQSWAAYDVPRHLYHFYPETIKQLFHQHGFAHLKSFPMKLDAYYVSMLSEKNLSGSIAKGIQIGKKSNKKAKKDPERYSSTIYVFKKAK